MRGILLGGGKSRRMGKKKQWLPFDEKPILLHTYRELCAISNDVVIVANDPEDTARCASYGLPTVQDVFPGQGPLAGLHSGLQGLEPDDCAVLVGCDLPFARADLFRDLIDELLSDPLLDAVVPQDAEGRLYPVCAAYRARVRDTAEAFLQRDDNALRHFLGMLHVRYLPTERWSDLTHSPFFNMNTPEDYDLACTLWKKEGNSE
ncbi:MAG: molybdenum cofactor guanylyltransferase [Tumebacillaceae bacterium]